MKAPGTSEALGFDCRGVESMVSEAQSLALLVAQLADNEVEIHLLIRTVDLVAHDRMSEMAHVDSDLVLPARSREDFHVGERCSLSFESA